MPRSTQSYSSASSCRRRFRTPRLCNASATIARMFASDRLGSALAQERGAPQPLHWIESRPEQQRGVRSPEPPEDLARRRRIGPRLGVADRDLAAIGQAGFQCRAAPAVDDDDLVACRAQKPGAGHSDDPGAQDENTHHAVPIAAVVRFYGAPPGALPRLSRNSPRRPLAARLAGYLVLGTILRFRRRSPPDSRSAAAMNDRDDVPAQHHQPADNQRRKGP